MNKNARVAQPRTVTAGVVEREPSVRRKPFRLWMTGSLALVMLSFAALPDVIDDRADDERADASHLERHSPFDAAETLRRLEAAAAQRGLGVLARVDRSGQVLVLASSDGATPAVISEPGAPVQLPLSLQVRACETGGAKVFIAKSCAEPEREWPGLPRAVLDDLTALPHWVDETLAAATASPRG